MSDTEKSGEPTQAADSAAPGSPPAEKSAAPSGSAATQPAPSFGVFSPQRGSGLARGKRPAAASAPSAPAPTPTGYKPTALEVITPQSEYKNPFTGETSVSAPVTSEPIADVSPANEPVTQAAPVQASPVPESSASLDASTASTNTTRPDTKPKPDMFPYPENAPKPELNILPPEPARRPDVR